MFVRKSLLGTVYINGAAIVALSILFIGDTGLKFSAIYFLLGISGLLFLSSSSTKIHRKDFRFFLGAFSIFLLSFISNLANGKFPNMSDIFGYLAFSYLILIFSLLSSTQLEYVIYALSKVSFYFVIGLILLFTAGIGVKFELISGYPRLTSAVGFNTLAFHLAAAGIFSMYYLKKTPIVFRGIIVVIVGLLVFYTSNRTAFFGFIVAITWLFKRQVFSKKNIFIQIFLIGIAIIIGFKYVSSLILYMLTRGVVDQDTDVLAGRDEIWFHVLDQMTFGNYIYGIGSNNLIEYIDEGGITSLHNTYLQLLVETGFLGVLIYIFFVGSMLLSIIQEKKLNDILVVSVIFLLLNTFTESRYFGIGGIGSIVLTVSSIIILIGKRTDHIGMRS